MATFGTLLCRPTASVTLLVPASTTAGQRLCAAGGTAPDLPPGPAGALHVAVRLGNLALTDFGTYLVSVILMLLFVRFRARCARRMVRTRLDLEEMKFGWDYILAQGPAGLLAVRGHELHPVRIQRCSCP
jgi:hypothetical protein